MPEEIGVEEQSGSHCQLNTIRGTGLEIAL
jgi:hypothetical protein